MSQSTPMTASNNPVYERGMRDFHSTVKWYYAQDLFFSGDNWEVQPVQMGDLSHRVHLWPIGEMAETVELTPDNAERLGCALIASAAFARQKSS
jgi:hypothetical protein